MPHASALLVIDMQNALVSIGYRAAETVAAIARLRERARAAGVPIVTVQHQGPEMEAGSEGWRIVPELAPAADEAVVHKTSADGFLDTDLDRTLKALGVTEVVVTGFATEICVDTTARQALSHGYDLVLVADGHTTSDRTGAGEYVSPKQSIAHHNEIYRHIDFPGRSIRVLPASEVDFAAAGDGRPDVGAVIRAVVHLQQARPE
ncbi:isochorismatase family protein [Streptomyces sp. NPDC001231]|uniref:isochorismatase family protein n=1 Tax=Streptomyces sp. NPDC001231 TaxID=3364549 RepID=UPI00368861C4